ncbi:MAG: 2-hydroxyacid dehydrogenase [Planctomycetota bacterium]
MKTVVFSTKPYDRRSLEAANAALETPHDLVFLETRLHSATVGLAAGYEAVCVFVNDQVDRTVVQRLADVGVKVIATRSAGFNQIDIAATNEHGIPVVRVPAYAPEGVAEHAIALMMTLNRKTHRAYNRVRESNFALNGLLGFDMHGKTAGVVGTGKIGAAAARILLGFGCRVLAHDRSPREDLAAAGVEFVPFDTLAAECDIITLHCPLVEATHHLINAESLAGMKDGVMLINTSRGALIDTDAVIEAVKAGKVGHLGLDVYEEEDDLFFEDRSGELLQDDDFARLLTFPNVLITGHQAFFTVEALKQIAEVTLNNLTQMQASGDCDNRVTAG